MLFLRLCLSVLLCAGLCHGYFAIVTADEDLICKESGMQCLSNNKSFVTCVNADTLTILSTIINCPDGYYCDDSTNNPCVLEPVTTSTTSSTSTTSTTSSTSTTSTTSSTTTTTPSTTAEPTTIASNTSKETTAETQQQKIDNSTATTTVSSTSSTVTSTTRTKVARPTGAPDCTTTGFYAAPACNQYYECVETTFLFIFKFYKAELNTCPDGDYYDTGYATCVLASESDCE